MFDTSTFAKSMDGMNSALSSLVPRLNGLVEAMERLNRDQDMELKRLEAHMERWLKILARRCFYRGGRKGRSAWKRLSRMGLTLRMEGNTCRIEQVEP